MVLKLPSIAADSLTNELNVTSKVTVYWLFVLTLSPQETEQSSEIVKTDEANMVKLAEQLVYFFANYLKYDSFYSKAREYLVQLTNRYLLESPAKPSQSTEEIQVESYICSFSSLRNSRPSHT